MWFWTDMRARLLVLPVLLLQLVYILSDTPQHSLIWHVVTGYMYLSIAFWPAFRFRDDLRRRHASSRQWWRSSPFAVSHVLVCCRPEASSADKTRVVKQTSLRPSPGW